MIPLWGGVARSDGVVPPQGFGFRVLVTYEILHCVQNDSLVNCCGVLPVGMTI